MAKPPKTPAPFPSREDILRFIRASTGRVGPREVARAFGLDSRQKSELRQILKELEREGRLEHHRRRYVDPGRLPETGVLVVTGTDADGELTAEPVAWAGAGEPPRVRIREDRAAKPALGRGDKVLARLAREDEGVYSARIIRRLAHAPARIVGIVREGDGRRWIHSVDRRDKQDFLVETRDLRGSSPGEVVVAEAFPTHRLGPRQARVVERLGRYGGPKSASSLAIAELGIPESFTPAVLAEAEAADPAPLAEREDLRALQLVTIDGADARDFDDAVWAAPDEDPANPGGWILVVAIADVAWYVRPGGALDESAHARGNSVYFPDRVVPMLPEALSAGWCSLKPGEDRPCLAARIWIDADGVPRKHRFTRAMMRSAARLTYEQVQQAHDGEPDETTAPLLEPLIRPLYGAYRALSLARAERGVLELDVPERRVVLDAESRVLRVEFRARYDSHRLIEDFMIAANVAAAETLERMRQPSMYRVHDEPTREKLDALREFLDTIGLRLVRGQVMRPAHFNIILEKARRTPHAHIVNEVVLRSQAQAEYAPENIGHFGLALVRYCHFTSPIRRYSDILVHRALIRGLKLGAGGLEEAHRDFRRMGAHLSFTERRAQEAERDAVDRFTAAYLSERVGATFAGKVRGVTRAGLFVTLDETGADGLLPMSMLGGERYVLDERRHRLKGQRTGREFRLGDRLRVTLREADPVTGGMIFAPAEENGDSSRPRNGRLPLWPGKGPRGRFRREARRG
ncbi:MAG: ribonuclease R [Rhodospirillales bacterium RIFCSPLOWO2_12_FULL_67_15]|nr:MAG: ribonuclease R [Rhodospirillales bacterium RIFCSPLOWO2_12_FULL_67_15]